MPDTISITRGGNAITSEIAELSIVIDNTQDPPVRSARVALDVTDEFGETDRKIFQLTEAELTATAGVGGAYGTLLTAIENALAARYGD